MHPPIPNEINKILNLSPELWADFEAKLKPLSVNKGEYFLQEGDLCNQVALLSKGAFYSYYRKDGDMAPFFRNS